MSVAKRKYIRRSNLPPEQQCRLCGAAIDLRACGSASVHIFKDEPLLRQCFELDLDPTITIRHTIEQLIGVQMPYELHLPTQMCGKCYKLLKSFYRFREKCRELQKNVFTVDKPIDEVSIKNEPIFEANIKDHTTTKDESDGTASDNNEPATSDETSLNDLLNTNNVKLEAEEDHNTDSTTVELNASNNNKRAKKHRYPCEVCGKFLLKWNLKLHVNTHTDFRPFHCVELGCDKAFHSKPQLNRHIKGMHTNCKLLECDTCGKTLRGRSSFIVHLKYHSNPKLPCPHCSKMSYTKKSLKKHLMTHTGERPYPCQLCPKEFQTRYNWRVHQRVHTKDKPFECSKCPERFGYNSLLKAHSEKYHPDFEHNFY